MHRTEGANHVNNLFTVGPPPSTVTPEWLNSIQEEICHVIEGAGKVVNTQATDTVFTQLFLAMQSLIDVAIATISIPANMPRGLILSNAADTEHDITIAAGVGLDSTSAYMLILSSAITKQIDATWAPGTNAGGLFTGSIAANTEYFMFLIRKDSDGTIDAGCDTDINGSHIPAGYTVKRLLRGVRTDGSANIVNNQWLITDTTNDRVANLIVYDQKNQNTAGDAYAANAWRTRIINTVNINEIPGASLASNQITLPAGYYKAHASAVAYPNAGAGTYYWRLRIYNVTDSTELALGLSLGFNNSMVSNYNRVEGEFCLTAAKLVEVQCICQYNITGGVASNLAAEKYLMAHFQKIG